MKLPIHIRRKILSKIHKPESGCWEWQGYRDAYGYGRTDFQDGETPLIHRRAYMVFRGPIPNGMQIDHICRNRACCNPWHLRAVTAQVNSRVQKNTFATHCKSGHEFSGRNLIIRASGKWARQCRECANAAARKYQSKKRMAA